MIKCPNCSFDNLEGSAYCDGCGAALADVSAPAGNAAPPPARVVGGRYRIERELGGGGQKQMYLAADLRLSNRLCALAELTPSARGAQAVAEGRATFRREAQTLAALNNFHIVQVYDYLDEGGRCYLVEEYVGGQTLQQRIAGRGRLDVAETVEIALQILDALEYLHGLVPPLVHRDLKPDNVMLAPATGGAGVVKLIDFGIARHFQPQRGTVHGTPGYAAPEQYQGISEPRTDLYALGAILHYALSGRDPQDQPPFSFPPLHSLRADLPQALCALVDRALSIDLQRRPASAGEFKARLQAAVSAPAPAAKKPPSQHPPVLLPAAPTVTLPAAPQPQQAPAPAQVASPFRIEWTPAEVVFTAVERGGSVEPITLTVRNIGRGRLEAHVDTDRPDLVRVTPGRIAENQAHLRVQIDPSAVMWGHRYRANLRLVLDHSGATVAIPVVIEAAEQQAILDRVRKLASASLATAAALALSGEIVAAGAGFTLSGSLQGAASARLAQAGNIVVTMGLLALLILGVAARRRGRLSSLLVGLIAISVFRAAIAALFIDYLMLPALIVALTRGGAIILRRACIRMLARQGLGLRAQAGAFLLLMAPPAAVLTGAGAWMAVVGVQAPSGSVNPWPPQPPPSVASNPTPAPTPSMPRYRATVRARRTPLAPELIESELRGRLALDGFGDIGVSVDSSGRAYISGSAADFEQKREIERIARGVAGVRSVISSLDVPKGWMGVTVRSEAGGATVTYVAPGSPADHAGIAAGDVIVAIDSDPVRDYADFHRAIETKAVGQTITVALRRGVQDIALAVRLVKKTFRPG